MVESAIVIPLMTFLILGILQLAMVQHARIMTDYAAFNAARAGIVWNADRFIMENAAIISLLPTNESLVDSSGLANPQQVIRRIMQRALVYQINRRVPQAIGLMRSGAGSLINAIPGGAGGLTGGIKNFFNSGVSYLADAASVMAENAATTALGKALGATDARMVRVDLISPTVGSPAMGVLGSLMQGQPPDATQMQQALDPEVIQNLTQGNWGSLFKFALTGNFGASEQELEFDVFRSSSSRVSSPRLSIRVRYLYLMRIPFANWVIHSAWLATQAGKQLYGAVWNPQENVPGETGFRNVQQPTPGGGNFGTSRDAGWIDESDLEVASILAAEGAFVIPLSASYTMVMQSNPYRRSVQLQ